MTRNDNERELLTPLNVFQPTKKASVARPFQSTLQYSSMDESKEVPRIVLRLPLCAALQGSHILGWVRIHHILCRQEAKH